MTWKHEKHGIYTTKSGYAELMRAGQPRTEGEDESDTWQWRWCWKLGVLPKVRLFIWRVLCGIVPTKLNLITRYVDVEP